MRQFTISRNLLLGALLRCKYAFNRRNAIIEMGNFLFYFCASRLLVTATDGDIFMQESLRLDNNEDTDGVAFGLDRNFLLNAIKSLDEQPLRFNLMDYQVEIVHSQGWFYLKRFDALDLLENMDKRNDFNFWVTKGVIPYIRRVSLEIPGVKHWIDLGFNSLACDELRPAMNCVCLDFKDDNHIAVAASDGHQLTVVKKHQEGVDFNAKFLLPKKVCQIIQKCLPKTGIMDLAFTEYKYEKDDIKKEEYIQKSVGAITVNVNEKDANHTLFIRFRNEGMDSRYPNYNSVIPIDYYYFLDCDRLQLLKSVGRMMQFACSNGMVVLNISPEKMTISADDHNYEVGANEELPCKFSSPHLKFPELKVGLKGWIVASLLRRMTSERVCMSFVDSTHPCIMQPKPQPDVEDLTFLIMPMLCND